MHTHRSGWPGPGRLGQPLPGRHPIVNNFNSSGDASAWAVNYGTGTVGWDATTGPMGPAA